MQTASCVTPPGRSAIATIVVRGPGLLPAIERFFRPRARKRLADYPSGRVVFGTWTNLHGTQEELVVSLVCENEVQVHCHGGAAAIESIMDCLRSCGITTQLNSRADLHNATNTRKEIEYALLNAPTQKIASLLLQMQAGNLEQGLNRILENFQPGASTEQVTQGLAALRKLEHSFQTGQFLLRAARVVLAGEPNVGKSSLNNRILGYSRSIVFDQPGTTRDVVAESTVFDGWEFEFSDTAGIRQATDSIEAVGVERARQRIHDADLVVRVRAVDEDSNDDSDFLDSRISVPTLVVLNKVDRLPGKRKKSIAESNIDLCVSAKTGEGIENLLQRIRETLIPNDPDPATTIFTERQRGLVMDAIKALKSDRVDNARDLLIQLVPTRT